MSYKLMQNIREELDKIAEKGSEHREPWKPHTNLLTC